MGNPLYGAIVVLLVLVAAPRASRGDLAQEGAVEPAGPQVLETRYERLADAGEDRFGAERIENPFAVWPEFELLVTVRFDSGSDSLEPGSPVTVALPDGLVYVPGSAVGPGTSVWVSTDGGQQFLEERQRRRSTPGASGFGLSAIDGPGVTHLRWIFPYPMEPAVTGFLRYRVLRGQSVAPKSPMPGEMAEAAEAGAGPAVSRVDVANSAGDGGPDGRGEVQSDGESPGSRPDNVPQ